MSFSGSSDSRCSSWATTRLAIWSSTSWPRKITRSRSRREEMANERSPRPSCSTTTGTSGMSVPAEPSEHGLAREAPLPGDAPAGQLAGLGELPHVLLVDLEQRRDLIEREHVGRGGRLEGMAAHRHLVGRVLDRHAPRAEA